MTPQERETLEHLCAKMRAVAGRVGSLHAWWEDISMIETLLAGRWSPDKRTAGEWIAEARRMIGKTSP